MIPVATISWVQLNGLLQTGQAGGGMADVLAKISFGQSRRQLTRRIRFAFGLLPGFNRCFIISLPKSGESLLGQSGRSLLFLLPLFSFTAATSFRHKSLITFTTLVI